MRVIAHLLAVERLRYSQPPVPHPNRVCIYCPQGGAQCLIDDEFHALIKCNFVNEERIQLFQNFCLESPFFHNLSNKDKFKRLLCPITAREVKLINSFIKQMFKKRGNRDKGENHPET